VQRRVCAPVQVRRTRGLAADRQSMPCACVVASRWFCRWQKS